MNYGTDLKLKKDGMRGGLKRNDQPQDGYGGGTHVKGKDAPREGAAPGQGWGLHGYDAGRTAKAMESIKGGGGKPCYYNAGGKGER